MLIQFLIFIFVAAIILAILEIQIEGPCGWAKNLPTWRSNPKKLSSRILCFLLNKKELTGYHLSLWALTLFFFHLPLFWGIKWSISVETTIVGGFLLFLMVEDFLWFVFNPAFGISKFKSKNIPWHKNWWGPFPRGYYLTTILALILFSL